MRKVPGSKARKMRRLVMHGVRPVPLMSGKGKGGRTGKGRRARRAGHWVSHIVVRYTEWSAEDDPEEVFDFDEKEVPLTVLKHKKQKPLTLPICREKVYY